MADRTPETSTVSSGNSVDEAKWNHQTPTPHDMLTTSHEHSPDENGISGNNATFADPALGRHHHQLLHPSTWFTPSSPPALWQETELALKANDMHHAQKFLRKLTKHSEYALRAHTLLMVIALAQDWPHQALSSSTAKLLATAAENGSRDAAVLLLYLQNAKRCKGPTKESYLLIEMQKGAEGGFAPAQAVYGLYLARAAPFDSVTGSRDFNRARELLVAAGKKGHFLALDRLEWHVMNERSGGEIGEDGVSSADYFGIVKQAAEAGHGDCAARLAKLLRKGVGCAQSEEEAKKWIRKAAELNVPPAVSAAHAEVVRENLSRMRRGEAGFQDVRTLEGQMGAWRGDGGWSCIIFKVFGVAGRWEPGGEGVWRFWEERERIGL